MQGTIFDLKRFAVHDGPGVRTTVFLKGCPLRCAWCHSPESQAPHPELLYSAALCIGCAACAAACPHGLLSAGPTVLDRHRCRACGSCAEVCYSGALRLVGERVGVDDLLERLCRDHLLHASSGGGVTISGGEPALQPEFASALLQGLQSRGQHTAIETAGHVTWPALATLLEHTDLVLFDFKHADAEAHRRLCGVDNSLIIANLQRISGLAAGRRDGEAAAGSGASPELTVRVPVIPGYNDDTDSLIGLADLLAALPALSGVELLPYHNLGVPKYSALGRTYDLPELPSLDGASMSAAAELLRLRGLKVSIEGLVL